MNEPGVNVQRPRGRRRGPDGGEKSKADILQAATGAFAELGYDAASVRAIARRAEVDPALVYHYFDTKAGLFAATVSVPFRPDLAVARMLAGDHSVIGVRLVRFILEQLQDPARQAQAVTLVRAALGQTPPGGTLKEFIEREVLLPLAAGIGGPDAPLRATLAGSQIVGMLALRYVLAIGPIASASIDELVERIGPVIQWHLVDCGTRPGIALDSEDLDGK